ncbi:FG-GAP repeat domain-containing protein [Streptomyces sp. NPDC093795]|uniref:FG-GAP repeat domain-containing protein n=1 Tax=Streptomyces sp. NPDC093795 TaxID=3366051 RepID=UPI0038255514
MSRRISVSVAVVLAVAAATPLLAPAATAAPASAAMAPAAPAATAPAPVPFLASGGLLRGAGATGFASYGADGTSRWTRYADGVSTAIETGDSDFILGSASDVVAVVTEVPRRRHDQRAKLYDMASGAAPVTIELTGDAFGSVEAVAGSFLVMNGMDTYPKIVSRSGDTDTVQRVMDPYDSFYSDFSPGDSLPGLAFGALHSYGTPSGEKLDMAVVDLATGRLVERYEAPVSFSTGALKLLSPSHVGWTEVANGKVVLASAKRGAAEVRRVPLAYDSQARLVGGLIGDWFMSADTAATAPGVPQQGFTARSLTDGTTVPVLNHARSVTKGPDNTLLALGTTDRHGEGVYRISVGADGKPATELIASTGETDGNTTPITYVGHGIPAAIHLDGVAKTRLAWKFSTTKADLAIDFKHKATGRIYTETVRPGTTGAGIFPDGSLGLDWTGDLTALGRYPAAAPNGAYEWKVTATPWNGMPPVTASGTTQVIRTPRVHDYTGNGSPDLLVRKANGSFDGFDTRWDDATGRLVRVSWGSAGGGGNWGVDDLVESVGDVAGATTPDILSRDKDGVLWLHLGNGQDSFAPPAKVGGGWNTYDLLAGGSELTGDGRSDLVAVDKAGDLYLYNGTGSVSAPYGVRKKIGVGWGIYNELTAVGNIAGAPAGDLLARDKAGVLWLYLGKGDGTYAPRIMVGGGWGGYRDIVGIGDANKDGRPDLYVRNATNEAYFYAGTGSWRAPFAGRVATEVGAEPGTTYNQVF